jgi:hypothetical protein
MSMFDITELQKNFGPLYYFMPLISVIALLNAKVSMNLFVILVALVGSILLAVFQYSIGATTTKKQTEQIVKMAANGGIYNLPNLNKILRFSPKMILAYTVVVLMHLGSYLYLIWFTYAKEFLILFVFQIAVFLYIFALAFIFPPMLKRRLKSKTRHLVEK